MAIAAIHGIGADLVVPRCQPGIAVAHAARRRGAASRSDHRMPGTVIAILVGRAGARYITHIDTSIAWRACLTDRSLKFHGLIGVHRGTIGAGRRTRRTEQGPIAGTDAQGRRLWKIIVGISVVGVTLQTDLVFPRHISRTDECVGAGSGVASFDTKAGRQ